MKHFGLLGQDIAYSLSPLIHQEIAKRTKKEMTYVLLDGDQQSLKPHLLALKANTLHGLNVTKPYKSTIMQWLDDFSPIALRLGAVNTIIYKDGQKIGDNTDYYGFKQLLISNNVDVKDQNVLLLGNGGAARACYAVLTDLGAKVKVACRKPNNHHALFKNMISYEDVAEDFDIYVNTVSNGVDVIEAFELKYQKEALMIDINYQHHITQPMSHFIDRINGIDMLIYQAVYSQSLWYDQEMTLDQADIEAIKGAVFHE
ncbi:MAG: shikimate dehydrogenase family protein [Acholeplasmataceae bacterium]